MIYERLLRPWLFKTDAEEAHERVSALLETAQSLPGGRLALGIAVGRGPKNLSTSLFGLSFPNPIGLAAGFDKHARLTEILPALGFGFLEIGSVTLNPQPGNPKPRLFRLPESLALINRMGFNSEGASAVATRLAAARRVGVPLGINLGLNAGTPHEDAARHYAETFRILAPYGDYFVINVSSPNTTGLRDLQQRLALEKILEAILPFNRERKKPILVKIDPDGSAERLPELIALICRQASGVIVSNTTLSRSGVPSDLPEIRGGLSGAPLRLPATRLIYRIHQLTQGLLPIIGVGGILSGADAFEKIRAGANLVQMYTGLIYGGPRAIRRVQWELADLLDQHGYKTVAEAVGTAAAEEYA